MGLANRFSDNDPYIQSAQTVTANNNQASLNTAIAENDYLRASAVTSSGQSIIRTPGTPFPSVATASQNTIGAALGGIGQEGTPSEEPDGGGIPCFAADTRILMVMNHTKAIQDIVTGVDHVFCFDPKTGVTTDALVIGKHEHWVNETYHVTFENGQTTVTTKNHKYWTPDGSFKPISQLELVIHWNFEWQKLMIKEAKRVKESMIVYNLTVQKYHNYVADGMAVSNLKPIGNPFE